MIALTRERKQSVMSVTSAWTNRQIWQAHSDWNCRQSERSNEVDGEDRVLFTTGGCCSMVRLSAGGIYRIWALYLCCLLRAQKRIMKVEQKINMNQLMSTTLPHFLDWGFTWSFILLCLTRSSHDITGYASNVFYSPTYAEKSPLILSHDEVSFTADSQWGN